MRVQIWSGHAVEGIEIARAEEKGERRGRLLLYPFEGEYHGSDFIGVEGVGVPTPNTGCTCRRAVQNETTPKLTTPEKPQS